MANAISSTKPLGFRHLQPRAAAALDFNEDSDDDGFEGGGLLSADYKAQRRTTQDLVDFFKSGPPPSPPRPSPLAQMMEEEGGKVKKKNLFSRLKSRKSSAVLNEKSRNNKVAHANNTTATTMSIRTTTTTTTTTTGSLTLGGSGFGGSRRSSVLAAPLGGPGGTGSTVSSGSGMTVRNSKMSLFNASNKGGHVKHASLGSNSHRDSFTSNTSSGLNKKYVMIAVDYRDVERGVGSTGDSTALASGASSLNAPPSSRRIGGSSGSTIGSMTPRRHSRIVEEQQGASPRRSSLLTSGLLVIEEAMGDANGLAGDNKRKSIIIQSSGESSKFALDGPPLFLDSFAIDTDFITGVPAAIAAAATTAAVTTTTAAAATTATAAAVTFAAASTTTANDLGRSALVANKSQEKSASAEDLGRNSPKRASNNKVKFNVAQQPPMDETSVTEALAQRLASHKTQKQLQAPLGEGLATKEEEEEEEAPPAEVVLPKTTPRKKVRHVQIQTLHCVVRPMYTQTEPVGVMDVELRERFSHTRGGSVVVAGTTTEIGTSTSMDMVTSSASSSPMSTASSSSSSTSTKKDSISLSTGRPNSKVASLVASLTQPTAATTATTTTLSSPATLARSAVIAAAATTTSTSTSTSTDAAVTAPIVDTAASTTDLSNADMVTLQAELLVLRQQNGQLQTQVKTLERHLAAESRARTRTAVAMQDTRDKFEMLSAMAYKKLKEMIFQRHVLELEVQELRAKVDLNENATTTTTAAGDAPSSATAAVEAEPEAALPTEEAVREGERLFLQQQQQQTVTV